MPLAGFAVQWVAGGDDDATANASGKILLGQATSGEDGSFHIVSLDTPEAGQTLCTLAWRPNAASYFRVDGGEDGPLTFPTEPAPGDDEAVIRVATVREPSAEQWQALGAYLAANRLVRTNDLSRQLVAPLADSPARLWPLALRSGALAGMGHALADTTKGESLLEQDPPFEPRCAGRRRPWRR